MLWMALGRRDPEHPFYPYLASLPTPQGEPRDEPRGEPGGEPRDEPRGEPRPACSLGSSGGDDAPGGGSSSGAHGGGGGEGLPGAFAWPRRVRAELLAGTRLGKLAEDAARALEKTCRQVNLGARGGVSVADVAISRVSLLGLCVHLPPVGNLLNFKVRNCLLLLILDLSTC